MNELDKIFNIESNKMLGEIDVDLKLRMALEDLRVLSKYLENDLLTELDDIILNLSEGGAEGALEYSRIRGVVELLANSIYRGLIDTEKLVIDEFKEMNLPRERIIDMMSTDEQDKERIENIYAAMEEMTSEEEEAKKIYESVDIYRQVILSKIREVGGEELYIPLIFKFYGLLSDSTEKTGELIFTENAIEEVLNLDREGVEEFLNLLSRLEIKVGNKEGSIISYYTYLNETTLKIEYNIYVVNPIKYLELDKEFEIGKIEEIEVNIK